VEQLSGVIKRHQGNWLESRLSQLGGKFAGLILVSLPAEHASALESDLGALDRESLNVSVTATGEQAVPEVGSRITLSVIGPDRQGIVQEISRVLASEKINVIELDSAVSSAAMSAEMIFNARIDACIPEGTDLDSLRDTLETIAEDMTLEIDLERVD
jgi:glycine cleavage system regulatory protein